MQDVQIQDVLDIKADWPDPAVLPMTNENVAAALSAFTVDVITPLAARQYFRQSDLWQLSRSGYVGKLQEAIDKDPANPAEIVAGLEELWALLYSDAGDSCGTTKPLYAAQVKGVVDYLMLTGQLTAEEGAGFFTLGGGLRHNPIDAAGIATLEASAAELELRVAAVDQIGQWNNAANAAAIAALDAGKTPAEIEQAARDVWGV